MDKETTRKMGSSEFQAWQTPRPFFEAVERLMVEKYGLFFDGENPFFELDAAASADNRLAQKFFSEERSGLVEEWHGRVWCNPPYNQLKAFALKAFQESQERGALVALLIPTRTDTAAFQDIVSRAAEIRFIRGRLSFTRPEDQGASDPAVFPSALVIFDRDAKDRRVVFWNWRDGGAQLEAFAEPKINTFIQGLNSTIL